MIAMIEKTLIPMPFIMNISFINAIFRASIGDGKAHEHLDIINYFMYTYRRNILYRM